MAEGARLEIVCTERYRGFESLSLLITKRLDACLAYRLIVAGRAPCAARSSPPTCSRRTGRARRRAGSMPTGAASASPSRTATSRSPASSRPARMVVRQAARAQRGSAAPTAPGSPPCAAAEALHQHRYLLQHLGRQRPGQVARVLLDPRRQLRRDRTLRIDQPDRRAHRDLQLGQRRHEVRPAQQVIGTDGRQRPADDERQLHVRLHLEQLPSDHQRRHARHRRRGR